MELLPNTLDNLLHRTATDFALLDFTRAAVNDLDPLRFGVSIHSVVKAGDELAGKECPVLFREGQHLGDFLGSNAHEAKISAFTVALASSFARVRKAKRSTY
jgi:hypothetical protein